MGACVLSNAELTREVQVLQETIQLLLAQRGDDPVPAVAYNIRKGGKVADEIKRLVDERPEST